MPFYPSEYREIPPVDLLSWLFSHDTANNCSHRDIYIDAFDDTKRLNSCQVRSLVRRLVAGLQTVGLDRGDAVCFHGFNHYLYSAIYLGIVGAGGCFVGSNPAYTTAELKHLFSTTNSKYFIVEVELLDKVLPALLENGIHASHIFIFDTRDSPGPEVGFKSWEFLLQHGERDWVRFNDETIAKSTTAALMSTSGTTGLPKAAVISHYALVASGVSLQSPIEKPYTVRRLISVPQFHAFATQVAYLAPLKFGDTAYIMRRFDRDMFLRYLDRYEITETAVVPPMIAALIDGCRSPHALRNLRMLWCAGSPLPHKLSEKMYGILHKDAIISQVWGMTELGRVTTFDWPEKDKSGSVGKLISNTEARVVDELGHELTDESAVGEIQIRSPSIMDGYLNNPGETSKAFDNGWLKTGDVGYFKDTRIYIIGRIKELIKVRGWQVSPFELECILLSHASIIDAAVVPFRVRSNDMSDEYPRAYVVLRPETRLFVSEQDVKDFVKARVAKYKALDGGVIFVDSIPRNGGGKIMRKDLAERAAAESALNVPLAIRLPAVLSV